MRLTLLGVLLSLLLVASLSATIVQITDSDTQTFYSTDAVYYRIGTNNPGNVPTGHSGFRLPPVPSSPPYGLSTTYTVTSGLYSLMFVNSLPPGSTVDGATLDLNLALTLGTLAWKVQSDPDSWDYVPTFGSTAGGGFITIQSGTASHTLPAGTLSQTGLDLVALGVGFDTQLAAGNNLTVSWDQSITFQASYGSGLGCSSCVKIFSMVQSLEGAASGLLEINYTGLPQQPEIPEPASLVLIGGGLVVLGWLSRKRLRA